MKFPFIGLTVLFMVSAPIATQATDFQIDKIVNDALAKAQAEQSVPQTSDVVTKSQPAVEPANDPTKDAPSALSNLGLKTEMTDPQKVQSDQNQTHFSAKNRIR